MNKIAKAYEALKGDLNNSCSHTRGANNSYVVVYKPEDSEYFVFDDTNGMSTDYQYICTVEEFNNYKPQKTVVDAVNGFKGEASHHRDIPVSMIWFSDACGWQLGGTKTDQTVCTVKEFNTEVESMSRHAGDELYERYVRAVKTPLTKETKVECLIGQEMSLSGWSEIKGSYGDGIAYRCVSGDNPNDPNAVFITGREYTANGAGVVDEYDKGSKTSICITGDSILKLIRMPKPSPAFTKAMSDAGEFVSGQEVFIAQMNTNTGVRSKRYYLKEYWCGSGFQMEFVDLGILFHNKEDAEEKCRRLLGLPKLDTRTDKEKADDKMRESLIDGKAYQFESKSKGEAITVEGVYSDSGSVFITVHGSFPKAVCTNIQPLTVANK